MMYRIPSLEELIFFAPLFSRNSAGDNYFGREARLPGLPVSRTLTFSSLSGILK